MSKWTNPSNPEFATIVAILTIAAGLMASLFHSDITAPFAKEGIELLKSGFIAIAFWVVVIFWMRLFYLRQLAESKALSKLQDNADKTASAVLALPPRTFFDYYSLHICNLKLFPPSKVKTREDKENFIRNLLRIITHLALNYDARPSAKYAANIMVYIDKNDSQHSSAGTKKFSDFNSDKDIKRFLSNDFSVDKIQGVLYLPKELSFTEDGMDHSIENNFVFPILTEYLRDGAWRVLPGAPVSFVKWNICTAVPTNEKKTFDSAFLPFAEIREAMHGVDDIHDMKRFSDDHAELKTFNIDGEKFQFGEEAAQKIKNYYDSKSGNGVKSFLSMPLVLKDGSCKAIGTLNIHCDSPTFLGAPADDAFRRRATFASVISSLVFDIAELVDEWRQPIDATDKVPPVHDGTSQ